MNVKHVLQLTKVTVIVTKIETIAEPIYHADDYNLVLSI